MLSLQKATIVAVLLNPTQETCTFHDGYCLCPEAVNVWLSELQRLLSMPLLPERKEQNYLVH